MSGRALTESTAMRALGIGATRISVIRRLCDADGSSVSDLMAITGLSRNGVLRHLRELQSMGLLIVHARAREHATKPVTHYRIARDELEALAWAAFDLLDPSPS